MSSQRHQMNVPQHPTVESSRRETVAAQGPVAHENLPTELSDESLQSTAGGTREHILLARQTGDDKK